MEMIQKKVQIRDTKPTWHHWLCGILVAASLTGTKLVLYWPLSAKDLFFWTVIPLGVAYAIAHLLLLARMKSRLSAVLVFLGILGAPGFAILNHYVR